MSDAEHPPARKITVEALGTICRTLFQSELLFLSEPGGPGRASVRLHFADRTLIATFRQDPARGRAEADLLQRLSQAGAPVPKPLGYASGVLFQQDVGNRRLSVALAEADEAGRISLARQAFTSLSALHKVANDFDLARDLPQIAVNPDWLVNFLDGPTTLSRQLGLPPPRYDRAATRVAVLPDPASFVKWDARPGNAAVQPDGRVVWFDWEDCGLRHGQEDYAFLLGDEFWPLSVAQSLELLSKALPERDLGFLVPFTTLHIIQRLLLMQAELEKSGWSDAQSALRKDQIGATLPLILHLCAKARDFARQSPATAALAPWFEVIGTRAGGGGTLRFWTSRAGR